MILLRCNVSPQAGLGHLMRCRTIAAKLKERGQETLLLGPLKQFQTEADKKLFSHWIERPDWDTEAEEAEFVVQLARRHNATHLMIDDYRSTGPFQNAVREAGLCVMSQYDASSSPTFAANFAVNASPSENRERHEARLLRPDVKFLNGPAFCVLGQAFSEAEPVGTRIQAGTDNFKILVTFGGGDDRGAIAFVLNALAGRLPPKTQLCVMSGRLNPRNDGLLELSHRLNEEYEGGETQNSVTLFVDPPNVPDLMSSCRLALMGGGTSTFETAHLGLPMVLMPIAENQHMQCEGWQALGAAVYCGPLGQIGAGAYRANVLDLLADTKKRMSHSRTGMALVDTKGGERLLDNFLA